MSLHKLKRERSDLKTHVTIALKATSSLGDQGELSFEVYEEVRNSVKKSMDAIEKLNSSIIDLMLEQEADENVMEVEMMNWEVLRLNVQVKLYGLCPVLPVDEVLPDGHGSRYGSARQETTPAVQTFHIKPLQMTLPTFSDYDKDAFVFKIFLSYFQNVVGSNPSISDEQKMIYLRSMLQGRTFHLVQSLSVLAENYAAVMDLLRSEFFQLKTLVDLHTGTDGKCSSDIYAGLLWYKSLSRSNLVVCC